MNHNQSSPTGYPQHPGGTPSAGQPATKAARLWFTKHFVIAGGLLTLFIAIGIAGGGSGGD